MAVLLTKRAGVAPADALAWAEAVRTHLDRSGFRGLAPVTDLSACQAKVACLTEKWSFRPEGWWLAVEVGDLIDEKLVTVKLLQKGAEATPKLAVKAQGADAALAALLTKQLEPLVKALEEAGITRELAPTPVAAKPEEPKVVAPPPPVKREPPSWSRLWWVPSAVAVASFGAGLGLLLSAYGDSDQLRDDTKQFSVSQSLQLKQSGELKQGAAAALFGVAGAAAVGAVVMLVTQLSPGVAFVPTPHGWAFAFAAPLP